MARAEGATLEPIYLPTVSMQLPLETPLPRQCEQAMPLLEAIERRAATFGVPVDSRIEIVVLRPAVAHQPADGESPLTA